MNILFVCRANFARSQMAEAIFNNLSKLHRAKSAGVALEKKHHGQELGTYSNFVVICMEEIGLDLAQNRPKELTLEMLEEADRVIVMVTEAAWPAYLHNNPAKIIKWNISDPKSTDLDFHRKVREEIREKVEELLRKLEKD